MRIAVLGACSLTDVDIARYMPEGITELTSGGAPGVETLAERYADLHNIPKLIFRRDAQRHTRATRLLRVRAVVEVAQEVVAIDDGQSRLVKYVTDYCRQLGKPVTVHTVEPS